MFQYLAKLLGIMYQFHATAPATDIWLAHQRPGKTLSGYSGLDLCYLIRQTSLASAMDEPGQNGLLAQLIGLTQQVAFFDTHHATQRQSGVSNQRQRQRPMPNSQHQGLQHYGQIHQPGWPKLKK